MIAISIWPINIYRYWIFYLLWFIGWYFFLKYLWKKSFFDKYPKLQKLLNKETEELLSVIILWVVIGWRIWHILIYDLLYYIASPLEMFKIWNWGMSFIWWLVGTIISVSILSKIKKLSKTEIRLLTDSMAMIVPLWIIFWRIWNFLNQELYWIIFQNKLNLSEATINILKQTKILNIYTKIDQSIRINTNFISSFLEGFLNLLILSITWLYKIKIWKLKPWFISGLFLCRYSFIRFLLEYIRQDSQLEFIWPFSKSQYFFIIFFILWIFLVFRKYKNKAE